MGQSPNLNLERVGPDDLKVSVRKGQVVVRGKCGQHFRIERQDVPELIELFQFAKEWADDMVAVSPRLQKAEQEREQIRQTFEASLRPPSWETQILGGMGGDYGRNR